MIDRRNKTKFYHLRFPELRDKCYTNTMFSKIKNVNNNICCQVFTNGRGDTHCYSYHRKVKVDGSLMDFINDIGMVPNHIVTNNAKETTLGEWKSTVDKFKIKHTMSESYSQWQKLETPIQTGYRPELDSSPELTPRQISFYQRLIGQLR